jgi:hypothetical protein
MHPNSTSTVPHRHTYLQHPTNRHQPPIPPLDSATDGCERTGGGEHAEGPSPLVYFHPESAARTPSTTPRRIHTSTSDAPERGLDRPAFRRPPRPPEQRGRRREVGRAPVSRPRSASRPLADAETGVAGTAVAEPCSARYPEGPPDAARQRSDWKRIHDALSHGVRRGCGGSVVASVVALSTVVHSKASFHLSNYPIIYRPAASTVARHP